MGRMFALWIAAVLCTAAHSQQSDRQRQFLDDSLRGMTKVVVTITLANDGERFLPESLKPVATLLNQEGLQVATTGYDGRLNFEIDVRDAGEGDCYRSTTLSMMVIDNSPNDEYSILDLTRRGLHRCADVADIVETDVVRLASEFTIARSRGASAISTVDVVDSMPREQSGTYKRILAEVTAEADAADARDRNKRQAIDAWTQAAGAIGCNLGGGTNCNGQQAGSAPEQTDAERSCTSNVQCGLGEECVKPSGSYKRHGICVVRVSELGIREHRIPAPTVEPTTVPSCSFNTDCPTRFECHKEEGQRVGICLKK